MIYLLDTNTCIYFLNQRSEILIQRIKATNPRNIVVCSIVKAELYYGALKSARPTENLKKQNEFLRTGNFLTPPPYDFPNAALPSR